MSEINKRKIKDSGKGKNILHHDFIFSMCVSPEGTRRAYSLLCILWDVVLSYKIRFMVSMAWTVFF